MGIPNPKYLVFPIRRTIPSRMIPPINGRRQGVGIKLNSFVKPIFDQLKTNAASPNNIPARIVQIKFKNEKSGKIEITYWV